MEKIIFFGLAIPILAYVLYLGGTAIMKGFSAKEANRVEKEESESQTNLETTDQSTNLNTAITNGQEFLLWLQIWMALESWVLLKNYLIME